MASIVNAILVALYTIWAVSFVIPEYLQSHGGYASLWELLTPPWGMLWALVLPLLVWYGVLSWWRYKQGERVMVVPYRPLVVLGSLVVGWLLVFNMFSMHPNSGMFRAYTEDGQAAYSRIMSEGGVPQEFVEDRKGMVNYVQSQRQWAWTEKSIVGANAMFLGTILLHILLLGWLVTVAVVSGQCLLHRTNIGNTHPLDTETTGAKYLLSWAIGLVLLSVVGLVLGALGIFTWWSIVVLGVLLLGFQYEATWVWCRWWWSRQELSISLISLIPLLLFALWFAVMMSGYQLFRPLPIGWDDMTVYMNIPALLADRGSLVAGFGAYAWSIWTAMALALGGAMSYGMLASWLGGVGALLGIVVWGGRFVGQRSAIMMAALFALMPMVQFQWAKDIKVDLGMLFVILAALYLLGLWWTGPDHREEPQENPTTRYGIIAMMGILLGGAFAIKYTAFLAIVVVVWIMLYRYVRWWSLLWVGGLGLLLLGLTRFPELVYIDLPTWVSVVGVIGGILLLLLGVLGGGSYRKAAAVSMLVLGVSMLLPVAPWLGKHVAETGSVSTVALLSGERDTPGLMQAMGPLESQGAGATTEETSVNGAHIELGRYQGYGEGVFLSLAVPYTHTMSTHVKGAYVDFGFLLLVFVPLAFMLMPKRHGGVWWNTVAMVLWVGGIMVVHGALLSQQVAQLPGCEQVTMAQCAQHLAANQVPQAPLVAMTAWWYEGTPAEWIATVWQTSLDTLEGQVVLWFMVALGIAMVIWWWRICLWSLLVKVHIVATLFYWVLWTVLASGVIWYGIVGLVPLLALVAAVWYSESDYYPVGSYRSAIVYIWSGVLLFAVALGMLSLLQQPEIPEFAAYKGGLSEQDTMERLLPHYREAAALINADPTSRAYRIGTFLPYFIENNDQRVLTDSQLEIFYEFYVEWDGEQEERFVERLRRSDIGYIVLDLNVSTIDGTADSRLLREHQRFVEFVNSTSDLVLEGAQVMPTTLSALQSQPPRVGTTLVFYSDTGVYLRVYTAPVDLTPPEGTTGIATGAGSGSFLLWSLTSRTP